MSLSVGIVGLPNVGKSTLFNALLKRQQALAANYPFATIEPNVGVVTVSDNRLQKLAEIVATENSKFEALNHKSFDKTQDFRQNQNSNNQSLEKLPPIVPATVEFVDIAGIVAGAHKGEGLGNQFLSHIREVDLIAHVVRDFEDSDVVRVGEGLESDYQTVISELIFKDLETISNKQKTVNSKQKDLEAVLNRLVEGFNEGKRAIGVVHGDDLEFINDLFLLTMKPQIVVVNVGEEELKHSQGRAVAVAEKLGIKASEVVVVSAKIESELSSLSPSDQQVFMEELGIKESGLERLAKVAYQRLNLQSFLTAGEKEVRAWTIRKGDTAVTAAGVIHSDFMAKFIKAEIVGFEDYVACGGRKRARELGKVRLEGRDYVMQEGDVVEFKIGS